MFFFGFFSSSCSKSAFFKPRNAHFKASSRSRAVSAASGYPATWDMTHWPNDWFHKACKRKTLYSCLFLSLSYRVYRTKVRLSGAVLGKAKLCASDQVLSKAPRGVQRRRTTEQGWNSTLQRQNRDQGECLHKRSGSYFSLLQHYPLLTEQQPMRRSSRQTPICARSEQEHSHRKRKRERARERQQGAPSVPPPRQQQRRGREAESV